MWQENSRKYSILLIKKEGISFRLQHWTVQTDIKHYGILKKKIDHEHVSIRLFLKNTFLIALLYNDKYTFKKKYNKKLLNSQKKREK